MDERRGFCAVRYSRDIAPGWLRERRSDAGASSRSSLRHVVRDRRAAPRGGRFWGTADAANLSVAAPAAEGGKPRPLGDQEGIGGDAQRGMMMEATPAASLVVPEAEFLFQLLVIAFDAPAPP